MGKGIGKRKFLGGISTVIILGTGCISPSAHNTLSIIITNGTDMERTPEITLTDGSTEVYQKEVVVESQGESAIEDVLEAVDGQGFQAVVEVAGVEYRYDFSMTCTDSTLGINIESGGVVDFTQSDC